MRKLASVVAISMLIAPFAVASAQDTDRTTSADPVDATAGATPSEPSSADGSSSETPREVIVTATRKKKVCREETLVGSRVPTKICRTVTEAYDEVLEQRDVMSDLRMEGGPIDAGVLQQAAQSSGREGNNTPP